mgnify:CR=1 FL=1
MNKTSIEKVTNLFETLAGTIETVAVAASSNPKWKKRQVNALKKHANVCVDVFSGSQRPTDQKLPQIAYQKYQ